MLNQHAVTVPGGILCWPLKSIRDVEIVSRRMGGFHGCSEYTRYSEYTRSIEYFSYSEY